MPPHCIFFFDILINVANAIVITIEPAPLPDGSLSVDRSQIIVEATDGHYCVNLPVSLDQARAEWRALFGRPTHTHEH